MIKERRKYPRADFHFTVRYILSNGKSNVVLSKNISKGGILVTTGEEFKVGLRAKLAMSLPRCEGVPLAGEVVRCKKIPKPGSIKVYNTAFKFIHRDILSNTLIYIDDLLKGKISQF